MSKRERFKKWLLELHNKSGSRRAIKSLLPHPPCRFIINSFYALYIPSASCAPFQSISTALTTGSIPYSGCSKSF